MSQSDRDLSPEMILRAAERRARESGVTYRGAVAPGEAFALVAAGSARIIDVRTRFEWDYVGRIPGSILVEWKRLNAAAPNPDFLSELAALGAPHDNYLFLCRSGVRSHAAALAASAAGYTGAFNILEGFEGDLDEHQQRGKTGGWRHAGLPWIQS